MLQNYYYSDSTLCTFGRIEPLDACTLHYFGEGNVALKAAPNLFLRSFYTNKTMLKPTLYYHYYYIENCIESPSYHHHHPRASPSTRRQG